MKNYLITGGAGFIGANFVKYILNEKKAGEIIVLDKLTYAGNLENLKPELAEMTFIKGDIGNRELVEYIFTTYEIDYVVNFAAESHVDKSIKNPRPFLETNVLGTQNLLEVAKEFWETRTGEYKDEVKFLQVSTDEVYGSLDETGYFTEESPIAPNNPYSATKAEADMMVRAYHQTYNLPVNITRCSNNYGPYQFPEKLIPLFLTNALNDEELPLYGDGKNIRDWLYVKDHCRAVDTVLKEGDSGEVYNIGGNNEKTNLEVTKIILKEINKLESLITYVSDRLGHDQRYAIDAGKIKKDLGWKPRYSFEEGIKETIKWYLENEEWRKKVKSGEYQEAYDELYFNK